MADETTNIELSAGTGMRFGAFVLDNYGARKLSELTGCNAPLMEQPPSQLGTFVLNDIFLRPLPGHFRRAVLTFGRRMLHAQREYTTGREVLIAYLTKLPQTNNHFLQALEATTHFEQCIASACQAANLFKSIVKLAAAPEVQDDRHRRLIAIWNRSKHFDEDITNPRRPGWGDAEIIAPVWLTNEGVSCADASITFEELHSFLIDLQNLFKSFAELPTP